MKNIFKQIFSGILVLSILLGSAMMTFAADDKSIRDSSIISESNESSNGVSLYSEHFENGSIISTSWKTIGTSTTGFNCNIYIRCMNTGISGLEGARTDIRMLNKQGNVVWSEDGAVAGLGSRTFWCGSDVYTIQARTQFGNGTIYIRRA